MGECPVFHLLTHERELNKFSNTGQLVKQVMPQNTYIIPWARKAPSEFLISCIGQGDIALVYPSEFEEKSEPAEGFSQFILLDGTWQEARKMFNHSSYLKDLPKVSIRSKARSKYTLRRNQKEEGLCTAECVIELLRSKQCLNLANRLEAEFRQFLSVSV